MTVISLGLSQPLPSLVKKKYVDAEAEKALIFSSTQLSIIHAAGIPVSFLD
jgi:hypothetical protein